jgi:hypothetical protein
MLHAARASVHHSSACAPDAGKAFLELRDLAGEAEPDAAAGPGRRVGNDRDPGSGAVTGPVRGRTAYGILVRVTSLFFAAGCGLHLYTRD